MPTSVRLDPELEARLEKLAASEGVTVSEVLRRAAARYCDELASASLSLRLADVLGIVESRGGRARRTGDAFRGALRRRRES
jgi:predicted DNA-binding protein